MTAFRGKNGLTAMFFALFAILLQALLPAAQALPWERSGEGVPDLLIVCSAWGTRTVTLETEKASVDPAEDAGLDMTSTCPVCIAHSAVVSIPGAAVPPLYAPVRTPSAFASATEVDGPPSARMAEHRTPRAPPATFS